MHRRSLEIRMPGRGTRELTREVQETVAASGVRDGMCNVFVHHTSAALIVCENADPTVRRDLETIFARLVPDGDPELEHHDEGPDDMAAHARTVLTQVSLTVPVAGGRADLGTWQGIYLWEHRSAPHTRRITITVW